MRHRGAAFLMLLLALPALGGCGTIIGLTAEEVPVYAGVQYDGRLVGEGTIPYKNGREKLGDTLRVVAVLDFPLSLALDTGLLPITLIVWIVKSASGDEPKP